MQLFKFRELEFGSDAIVNGNGNGAVFPDFSGNVIVRLLGGRDTLLLGGSFPAALVIECGDGDDLVGFVGGGSSGINIGSEFIVDLGGGADEISLNHGFQSEPHIRVGTSLIVTAGEGADRINIGGLAASRDFVIDTHTGVDTLNVFLVNVGNFLGVNGGPDADSIIVSAVNAHVISLRSGGGAGSLDLFQCSVANDLGLICGDGASIVRLYRSTVGGAAYIVGGNANEYIEVEAARVKNLQINGGTGYDRLQINGSLLDQVFGDLGGDGDLLVMNNTAVSGAGRLSGGFGYDVFFGRGNALGRASLDFFELLT